MKDDKYYEALAKNKDLGATRGIDGALEEFGVDALVMPSAGNFVLAAPFGISLLNANFAGYVTRASALAGYPIVTVPLGFLGEDVELAPADPVRAYGPGMPFGLCFIGTAWSEYQLIEFAYSYEQATKTRLRARAFTKAIPKTQLVDVL